MNKGNPGYDMLPVGDMVLPTPSEGELAFKSYADQALNILRDDESLGEVAHQWALSFAGVTLQEWLAIDNVDDDPRFAKYQKATSLFWTGVLARATADLMMSVADLK